MTRPFCVGLTGGVGAGKSTVAQIFANLGAEVVDTDGISRTLTAAGGAAMPAIQAAFGKVFVTTEGALDREAMRRAVFSDMSKRQQLENILHPLILEHAMAQVHSSQACYVVLVVPLLVERWAAYQSLIDRVAVVDCPFDEQMARVVSRPGLNAEQARAIIATQTSREARLAVAHDVIDNGSNLGDLPRQVEALHLSYLKQASKIS